MADIDERLRALFARACDSATTEEEARTCAVLLCRTAQKYQRALFVAPSESATSNLLAPEEVIALVANERAAARSDHEHKIRLLRANHAAEIAQINARTREILARVRDDGAAAVRGEARDHDAGRVEILVASWFDVGSALVRYPRGSQLLLETSALPHPLYEGAERYGRDWTFPPDRRGRVLHVRQLPAGWAATLDPHLVRDGARKRL